MKKFAVSLFGHVCRKLGCLFLEFDYVKLNKHVIQIKIEVDALRTTERNCVIVNLSYAQKSECCAFWENAPIIILIVC